MFGFGTVLNLDLTLRRFYKLKNDCVPSPQRETNEADRKHLSVVCLGKFWAGKHEKKKNEMKDKI